MTAAAIFLAAQARAVTVLFVVPDETNLTDQDARKRQMMESWGYTVDLITASRPQPDFDAAVATSQVAYISEGVHSADLNAKLKDAPIGIINEEQDLTDEYGFSSGNGGFTRNGIEITRG